MTTKEFVARIKQVVYDSAVKGCMLLLEKPPGRRPSPNLVELSTWFNKQDDNSKRMIHSVAELASHQAVFGLLSVIDGVRQIEDSESKGVLELRFNKDGQSVLLNNENEEYLHDLFNQVAPPL